MPLISKTRNGCSGWWALLALFCAGLTSSAEAQRHPESAGALPYYRNDPGITRDPEWQRRPPFLRGPQDRFQRGRARVFLQTQDSVPYLNYADEMYVRFEGTTAPGYQFAGRPLTTRNVRWDRMGNYMGGNYRRFLSIEESRSGSDKSGFSYIDHKLHAFSIGHYTYKDLHWTATVGNGISGSYVRTIFTPLTLSHYLQNVVRMDINYKDRDRGTLFYSRGSEQGLAQLFSDWAASSGDDQRQNSPVLNFGGHWQHNVGNYITFGSTFVNQIMSSPSLSRSSVSRGDLPYDMLGPKAIRVFIADDSPSEAHSNAMVYGADVILEGERAGEVVRLTSIDGDPDYDPGLEAGPPDGGISLVGGGREAEGIEAVVYTFVLPTDVTVRSARFVVDVAGDYRIGVRQTHDLFSSNRSGDIVFQEMEWPSSFVETEAGTRRPHKWYIEEGEEPYYTVVRSKSRDGSGANRRMVAFDYGIPTGQNLASVNWQAELVGLEFSGEAAHNMQNFMFPIGNNEGNRSSERAWAWWFKGVKDLAGGMVVGAETYRMDPNYSGGYDSYRGGMSFHSDFQPSPGARIQSVTQEFSLQQDNDDDDQFPDDHKNEVGQASPAELYPGFPHAQVYPGLDENADNIPDMDRNENFIVDWEEPFLAYDSEPPEFVYGIDFNNNGVPDFRENDDLPDYPYPRDQKGRHAFLRLASLGVLGKNLSVGAYDTRQFVGGGKSEGLYLRYEFNMRKRGVAELKINFDAKKVKDDIADHTYIFRVPPNDVALINWLNTADGPPEQDGYRRPATPDLLLMRDSWVTLAFLDSKYLGFRNINLDNSMLWFRNSQSAIEPAGGTGLQQQEDVRTRFSVVNRIDYTWTLGALSLTPKFKHRTIVEQVDSEVDPRVSYSDFIPILMAQYKLTPRTSIQAGAQGLPLLPFKRWDRVDEDDTYSQTDYVSFVKITADYFGLVDNSFMFGYKRTRRNFSRFEERNLELGVLFVELMTPL